MKKTQLILLALLFFSTPIFAEVHRTYKEEFLIYKTHDKFSQDSYQENVISTSFRLVDSNNLSFNTLGKNDIILSENNARVNQFDYSSLQQIYPREVDISFVIDSTGSMKDIINEVKRKVKNFVAELNSHQIKARLCLFTYKDSVEKLCNKFYEDHTANDLAVNRFIDEVDKIVAIGGDDPAENTLEAVRVAALTSPWKSTNQRIIVLITDASRFWFRPANPGEAQPKAPTYPETLQAIHSAQAQVMAIAPKGGGFDRNFFQYPSLVKASSGLFFRIDDIVKNRTNMNVILKQIGDLITTTYFINYKVDLNQLNPTLPLEARNIRLELANVPNQYQVKWLQKSATLPHGRPEYKKSFALTHSDLQQGSAKVFINGVEQTDHFTISNGVIEFLQFPAPQSLIDVFYYRTHLRDNILLHPFDIGSELPLLARIRLNQLQANADNYEISPTLDQRYLLQLKSNVAIDSDPFEIVKNQKLSVEIEVVTKK